MRFLYLHIGMGKTGTTAIQKFLNEQSIIYYPKCMLKFMVKINDLELWKNLYEEIKGVDKNVIISNEMFIHYLNIETLNYIKKLFCNFNLQIIFTCRKLNELIMSSYKENQYCYLNLKKYNNLEVFSDWIERMKNGFNFQILIRKWENIFGEKNINILIYNKNILCDFIDLVKFNSNIKINNEIINSKNLNFCNLTSFINDYKKDNSIDIKKYNIYYSNNNKDYYNIIIDNHLTKYNYYDDIDNFCYKYKIEKNKLY